VAQPGKRGGVEIDWPDTPGLGADMEAFREKMRTWIAQNRSRDLDILTDWNPYMGEHPTEVPVQGRAAFERWENTLREAGLLCPEWPAQFGGSGFTPVQAAILLEEMELASAPVVTRGAGELLVGPALLVHGTEEQKRRLLPRIISGEDRYCQGLSEPNAGSDLAAVRCQGVIEGDQIFITGQKVWTSEAAHSTHIVVLCRTDATAPKHHGLTVVLVALDERCITMRPLRQMPGGAEFCEVFFDRAPANVSNIVGSVNDGWRVVRTALSYERGGAATVHHLRFRKEIAALGELAERRNQTEDPAVLRLLSWAYAQVEIMRYQGLRIMDELDSGEPSGEAASIRKLFWSEYHQKFCELALGVVGPGIIAAEPEAVAQARSWRELYLWSKAETIYAGTSEIQRNIIAERVLGLPREPNWTAPPRLRGTT
jgi:alkylation response protein AidB-like acyl-CoA dehydrogenase